MSDTSLSFKQRIQEDMKAAMKAGEKDRLGVIRLILAAIKQREVDERIVLDDAQVLLVLDKMAKQRRESISQYRSANREDLAAVEEAELTIILAYLPAALPDEEIAAMVGAAIAETGAAGPADMGKVMAVLKPKMQGRADMSAVSAIVKQRLSS
ncbi:GatB/YqeY domain-containing protein [Methylogaea oryzae]|uniref:Aspartyl-tRNA amidotransferase subunit B n=1 Tax=Methylogaea oryzae TaxID=1295382 RepID=A0A8D5AJN0_9GAMM|nr:GatB/YqeY domain-containing protein [Methylogaea oryzae]BBL72581.1 aspartyl-tRNA amidotransferase subunit B [Methylogaea oryzae]